MCILPARSFGGALYFVTFIDDFSCKVWVYALLKRKDEVLSIFQRFVTLINETQPSKKVKFLSSNNDERYVSRLL